MDVLNEVSISEVADGGACFQQDPIRIDDVNFWNVVFVCTMASLTYSDCDSARALAVDDGQFPA